MIDVLILFPQDTLPHYYGKMRFTDMLIEQAENDVLERAIDAELLGLWHDIRHNYGIDDFSKAHVPYDGVWPTDSETGEQVYRPLTPREHTIRLAITDRVRTKSLT